MRLGPLVLLALITSACGGAATGSGAQSAVAPTPAAHGTPSEGEIGATLRAVQSRSPEVRACYQSALAQDRALHGSLTVQFTVGVGGAVEGVGIREDALGRPDVAECVLRVVGAWSFDPPAGYEPVSYAVPYVFSPTP